jgi:hypothetical protein
MNHSLRLKKQGNSAHREKGDDVAWQTSQMLPDDPR